MALIHQDLYQNDNLKGVNVKSYLEDLCSELFNTYNVNANAVELSLDIEDIILDIDTVIPLGLIINELITNSLKYAFSEEEDGKLSISLKQSTDGLVLHVKDNGIGYDLDKAGTSKSFGTKLIKALSKQLAGEIDVNSSNGTSIKIRFKKFQLA
jgi:two-component sensor histidine kinase